MAGSCRHLLQSLKNLQAKHCLLYTSNRLFSVLFVMMAVMSLLSGCSKKSAEKEDEETITVYLWSTNLYEKYAPYIQEQLPDINIEFVVGNNDLDFYRFLNENGGLPDIITCCRFSLHDASPLKDSLMDLSTTNAVSYTHLEVRIIMIPPITMHFPPKR